MSSSDHRRQDSVTDTAECALVDPALWDARRHPNNRPFGETALSSMLRGFSWSHQGGAHSAQGSREVRGRAAALGRGRGCNVVETMEPTVKGDGTMAPSP